MRPLNQLAERFRLAQQVFVAPGVDRSPFDTIEELARILGDGGKGFLAQVRDFERAWRKNSLEIDGQRCSVINPAPFFDPVALLPEGFQWNIVRVMPGVFTTFGILGTFLGISFGLGELGKVFRVGAEFGPMQEGVLGLMAGMSTAFWTSIFGILFSFAWIYLDRRISKKLISQQGRFLAAQAKVWPTIDTDTLWRYAIQISDDQRASLKTLATDIASSLVAGLNESVFAKLTPEVAQMREAIQQATAANTEIQVKGMEQMVERFGELLGERMKEQFENLANTIEMICEWQRQTKENLDELLIKLQEAGDRQSEMMKRSMEAGELFQNSLSDLGRLHDRLSDALAGFQALTTEMRSLSENVVKSEAAIEEASGKMIESLTTALGELGNLSNEYRKGFDEQLRSIAQLVSTTRTQAERLDETLRTSMEKFTEDCKRGVSQTFIEFDKNLSQLASGLSGTVQEIEDVLRRTHGNLDKVRAVSEDVGGASEGLRDGVAAFRELIARLNEAASDQRAPIAGPELMAASADGQ